MLTAESQREPDDPGLDRIARAAVRQTSPLTSCAGAIWTWALRS